MLLKNQIRITGINYILEIAYAKMENRENLKRLNSSVAAFKTAFHMKTTINKYR